MSYRSKRELLAQVAPRYETTSKWGKRIWKPFSGFRYNRRVVLVFAPSHLGTARYQPYECPEVLHVPF